LTEIIVGKNLNFMQKCSDFDENFLFGQIFEILVIFPKFS
jgi:hypothetical protein